MITRIVKLHFQESEINNFLNYFEEIKHLVNEFPGCHGLRLYRSTDDPTVVFTYSHWADVNALNAYRDSPGFNTIWPKIKTWFAFRPEAWTVECVFDGFKSSDQNR